MPDHVLTDRRPAAFPLRWHAVASALLLLAGLATTGCSSAQYAAQSLPQQFAARPPMGISDVDLSQLARPAPPTEMLHPGDTVAVTIATGLEERQVPTHELRIGDDGLIHIPLVGAVPIAGLNLTEAEKAIAAEGHNRGLYVNPNVTLKLIKPRSVRVTVAGAVNKPATYDLPASHNTLLTALTLAGGLTTDADTVVDLGTPARVLGGDGMIQQASHRDGASAPSAATQIDLTRAADYPAEALQLSDGAVVMVRSKIPGTVSVLGLVKSPGSFELPTSRETYLLDAIAMAGGTSLSVADRVLVTRRTGDGEMITISSSISKAKENGPANLLLTEGDIVSIEETPATVALDTIRTFFRIGFSSALPLF